MFFLSEYTLFHVSGILAIVVFGLFMSAFGKTQIYPESEHAVKTVWGFAAYGYVTIAYYLSGILIGVNWTGHSTIVESDWIKLVGLWVIIQVVRFIVIFALSPFLIRFSYGISRQELYIACFSTIKGGLNLTLSIMVMVDWVLPQRIKDLTIFMTAGIVILTHLINGSAARLWIYYLDVNYDSPVKNAILKNSIKDLISKHQQKEAELQSNKYL